MAWPQPIWARPGKLSCHGAVLVSYSLIIGRVNGRIMHQEISFSTLWLNASINGNPSCLFNPYGGDEYACHYLELVWGVRIRESL